MEVSTEQILSEIGSTEAPATTAAPAQDQWDWTPHMQREVEFTTNGGKKIKEPLDMVIKRAGLGYHAAQELHNVNTQKEKWAQIEARNKELEKWVEYDKYAQENPDWHKHLQDTWAQREQLKQQGQQVPPELTQTIQALQQKIEAQEKILGELNQTRTQEKQSAEDRNFLAEIDEVAKNFGVDLDQADEQGQSLAWRVTEHMKNMGLDGSKKGHFTMAFKDFHFDSLVGRQKEQAVEKHAKDQAALKKAGIIDVSRSPKGQNSLDGYKRGMSSSQIEREALEYLQSLKKA